MLTLETLQQEKKAEILRLAALHGCPQFSWVCSMATRENRPDSDVDFLVDLVDPDEGRSLSDLGGLLSSLKVLLGRDVDIVEALGLLRHVPVPAQEARVPVIRVTNRVQIVVSR